jgi:hypothetical protein
MFVARWTIDAKFGHKDEAIKHAKRWQQEIGDRVGMNKGLRVVTGSIGTSESRLEIESQYATLADLEKAWTEIAKLPAHAQFSKDLEPHIVSGSNRWDVFRVAT